MLLTRHRSSYGQHGFEENGFQGEKNNLKKRPRLTFQSVLTKGQDSATLPWKVRKEQINRMHRLKLVD